jgi:3-hydroxyisobutyrate dehydrogenase-like beta-hydroxyacid dehydrogenase
MPGWAPMSAVLGFVGAGQMGEPMIERLLGAGHEVHVYARREEVRQRLQEHGARPAASLAQLAGDSDVLISCVFSNAQLVEIISGPEGLAAHAKTGTVLISHTTGSVGTVAALAAAAPQLDIVDAPVSGTADDIAKGKLTILIGGHDAAVGRVTPILGAYANPIVATGQLGSALKIKLINNLLFAANGQLVAAAGALATRLGVEESRLLEALLVCSGGSRMAAYMHQFGGAHTLGVGIGPVIRKDVASCLSAANEAGVDLGLLGTVVETGALELMPTADDIDAATSHL